MLADSTKAEDSHSYFRNVAEARYLLRKVFRIAEDQAKSSGIDPLAHQALIQIFGSPLQKLRVNQLAERLDISPAFTSSLVRALGDEGLVSRDRDDADLRVIWVSVTKAGVELLDSMIESIDHVNIPVWIFHECHGTVELTVPFSQVTDDAQAFTFPVEKLQAVLAFFGDDQDPIGPDHNPVGKIQLPLLESVFAELHDELSVLIKHLDTLVVAVSDENISLLVACGGRGVLHKPVKIPRITETEKEFAVRIVSFDTVVGAIDDQDGA